MSSSEKNALVIGASRGLGLGLVKELTARGWAVTATVRDPQKAEATDGLSTVSLEALDINNAQQTETLIQKLGNRQFDLVFVNAGITGPALEDGTAEAILELFQTNTVSPIRFARQVLNNIKPEGTLAFMTSILGSVELNTSGGYDLYRASKAGLNTLTRTLVAELEPAHQKLTVLSVHPGWVRTDMGGPEATLSVEDSVRGIADQLEKHAGKAGHTFIDYTGETLPW